MGTLEKGEDEQTARLQPREWHRYNHSYHLPLQREEEMQGDNEVRLWEFARIMIVLCNNNRREGDTLR